MSADPQNDFRPGDVTTVILRKILDRLTTVAAGSGSGGGGGTVTILPGDVEIGAVELKNGADDTRAVILASAPVGTEAALVVRNIPSGTQPVSGPLTDAQLRASAVPVSGPLTDTQLRASAVPVSGPLTDTQLRASAVPISAAALPLPSGASTEATLAALNAKVTAVNTGAVVLAAGAAAIGSVSVSNSVAVTGPLTNAQLAALLIADNAGFTDGTSSLFMHGFIFDETAGTALTENDAAAARIDSKRAQVIVFEDATTRGQRAAVSAGGALSVALAASTTVIGNVGGKTALIKDTTAVSTSPQYTAGDAIGAKRTLANAVSAVGTGILESITILDRANQSAAMEILIFDADPTNATITDNTAFAYSTDDLKLLARITVSTSDYVTLNGKAVAQLKGLGVVLKAASGTSLYAVVVAVGTPTYAATTDLQVTFGILQD